MVLSKFISGVNTSFSSELNSNFAASLRSGGLNLIRALEDRSVSFSADGGEWGEAYIDANGRLNSVDIDETSAIFDTDKYYSTDTTDIQYYTIEATNLNISDFEINDCKCFKIGTGKWLIYSYSGTATERRAKILKTLFYGTDGSDARIKSNYITGITSFKTNISGDIGNKAYFRSWVVGGRDQNRTILDTVTGTDSSCSLWTYMYRNISTGTSYIDCPTGTRIVTSVADTVLDTFGSTGSTIDDPADIKLYEAGSDVPTVTTHTFRYLFFSTSNVSFGTATGSGTTSTNTTVTVDFSTDYGVPLVTEETNDYSGLINTIIHDIPTGSFPATISSSIGIPKLEDWETGSDVQYKLTNATEDSGWLNINEIQSFMAFTSEPTQCVVKLIPKDTSPTSGYPAISGFALYGDKNE